jgi:TrmH RNA methyltransferase
VGPHELCSWGGGTAHVPPVVKLDLPGPRLGATSRRVPDGRPPLARVYGLSAALAAYDARPELVARIAHTREQRFALRELLRDAARRKIAYREVEPGELERMSGSSHHEGVCIWLRSSKAPSLDDAIKACGEHGHMLALDAVDNPHNVGAIVRTAAYFGIGAVIVATRSVRALPPSALRVAEGGGERVCVTPVADLPDALRTLHARGYAVVGLDARASHSLGEHRLQPRTVAVLGNERSGLSSETRQACDAVVAIPGSGAIDSLNVSVAAGVVAHALSQQRRG